MSYWSERITGDINTPKEILQEVADDLPNYAPELRAVVEEGAQDLDGVPSTILSFLAINEKFRLSMTLFKLCHRAGETYPVAIVPPKLDLPSYLRRKRVVQTSWATILEHANPAVDRVVENKWVCAAPVELREKLRELLSRDDVIVRILSLRAPDEADIDIPGIPATEAPTPRGEPESDTTQDDEMSNL